ncbi:MAG TPA: hypothetical protein DIU15_04915 [Deltaproteobacteria bacterium]|nr:hypothetical protein [Deltaproteobacteria bacterium]
MLGNMERLHSLRLLFTLCLLWVGGASCTAEPSPGDDDDDTPVTPQPCEVASSAFEAQVCVHTLEDWATWGELALPSSLADQVAATKYLAPARDDARLPGLIMNAHQFSLHFDLLVGAFTDTFSGLSPNEYNDLILATEREFFAGSLVQLVDDNAAAFGFTVLDNPSELSLTVTYDQVLAAWTDLSDRIPLGSLAFIPTTSHQLEAAATWDAAFPIHGLASDIEYEVYTQGVGYGTVLVYTLDELDDATESAAFDYRNVLVLDEAPFDVERIISGAVTGTRQAELSHLNVRSAARGTPNCYIPDPHASLAKWNGQLVRLECGEDQLTIESATDDEAQAFWDELRPEALTIPSPDHDWTDMEGLLDVPTETSEQRAAALARYGAKGSNLGVLYQRIDSEYQLQGFLVPVHFYDAFIQSNQWSVDLGDGPSEHSFQDTLSAWLDDPEFTADGEVRRERLALIRSAMREAPVDAALIDQLEQRILDVFGDDTTMVRFRSSSNAEDALQFSGAGLYDSTSACLADERDSDDVGPSHCDGDRDSERSLSRAVRKVWASLWNMEAFEERDWYGIDHRQASMGILVNTRTGDEQANIVAFTANPTSTTDDRMLVNAQLGELDVVAAEPGVVPEKSLLDVTDGLVTAIVRVAPSSEVATGEEVLSDAQLSELGEQLWSILQDFPVDEPTPTDHDLLLDTEWKVRGDGQLIVKQVRPFLR